eukprot:COSAG05_NODE_3300_length_2165_cov_3.860116_2_plen_64_part_00
MAAENARYCRLLEVAQDVLVKIGVLNRAREAVDFGPARRRLALRRREELGRVELRGIRVPLRL